MPTIKVTECVVKKLVNLCNTYASGAMGDKFNWQDLERVCNLPYQTLCKNSEIYRAYKSAKEALQQRRVGNLTTTSKSTVTPTELEAENAALKAELGQLKRMLLEQQQRFVKWMTNLSSKGIDYRLLDEELPPSVKYESRKKNNIKHFNKC
jgi:hypothetical protein|tara:strand:+ start:13 stop:465 length:453 start_codon:yes stop_codon:yes gene_type:complete